MFYQPPYLYNIIYNIPGLDCPLPLQCYNMGHSGHIIYLYGVSKILMGNLHAGGHSDQGTPSPSTPAITTQVKFGPICFDMHA